ncbi:MAG: NAD(+) synthase [Bacteroidota bacterium]
MSDRLKLAGACLNQTPIDWPANFKNIIEAIQQAQQRSVDILCLPELCITGYGCEDLFLGGWVPEKALEYLLKIIPYTKEIAVTVGLPMRFDHQLYNTTCFISHQEIKGFYAKQKLAKDGVHYEPRWFSAWEANRIEHILVNEEKYPFGHIVVKEKDLSIGFEICEDAWQPNRPAELQESKVDVILNPSASHFAFGKAAFRENLVLESSRKFHCTYVYANLLGNEAGRMIYDGDVLIAHKGELLGRNSRLSFKDQALIVVELDRKDEKHLRNIQPNFPDQMAEFTHAAALALFDYCRKSKSSGFVLSLSGGADSSTIATLVAFLVQEGIRQLGISGFKQKLELSSEAKEEKDLVNALFTTAYQATKNSSEQTLSSAKRLAESIGAKFYSWNIDEVVSTYSGTIAKAIKRDLSWKGDDITLQNIQSRARSPIIWMLANLENKLLLATSNRSEGDVGYATMDGDTSGSISPIAGVSKHFILSWLQYAEEKLGFEGLDQVNQLTPTAELRPPSENQTDEDDLMPYAALRDIERLVVFEGKSAKLAFELLREIYDPNELREWIKTFHKLWARNQWKRERYAPSFHFDDFNIDPRSWYRFPILSGGYQDELAAL